MKRSFGVLLVMMALVSCRRYDLHSRLSSQKGLIPADQFARYGREQAEEMAIAREYGAAIEGSSPEALATRAEAAKSYALSLPDVADVQADPPGYRLTLLFKSGWRTMVVPIDDGKRGSETPGLAASTGAKPAP
jgi:hypothetical protein